MMTENDVRKALECCINSDCKSCPCNTIPRCCKEIDDDGLLALINRQKAEIERLKKDILIAKDAYIMLQTKNEIVKSEAVKEFAEELEYFVLNEDIEVVEPKCKDYESYINGANQFRHQIKNGINNLCKKRTE